MLAALAESLWYCDLGIAAPPNDVMLLSREEWTSYQLL